MSLGRGDAWIGVPVRCYTECNTWIKDEISQVGKPDKLTDLHLLAQSIDARYWECRSKITREMPANKAQDKPSDKGKPLADPANQNVDHRNLSKSS